MNSVGSVETESLGALNQAMDSLRNLFGGEGKDAINSDNFLKDLDANVVSEKLTSFTSSLGDAIGGSTETISGYAESFNGAGSQLASAVSNGIGDNVDTSGIKDLCSTLLNSANSYTSKFKALGANFSKGLGNGISSSKSFAVAKAKFVAGEIVKAVQQTFDSHSPSRVAMQLGKYFSEGLGIGIAEESGTAVASSEKMTRSIIDNARSGLSSLSSIIENNMDTDPVVRPVVDLTNVQSGAKAINGMLSGRTTISAKASADSAADTANSVAKRNSNQNGNNGVKSNGGSALTSEDNSVNVSGNFYVRSDNDIHSLASEIAALTKSQQRSLGGAY